MEKVNKKSLIAGIALLIICGGATCAVLIKEFRGQPILENISRANPLWVILGLGAMAFYSIAEGLNINRGLRLSGCKPRTADCLKYAVTGFFFSAITPSASGGQPAQLYYMKRDGVHLSFGAFSLLSGVISFQISSVFLGICGAVFAKQAGAIQNSSGLLLLFIVGFSLNFAALMLELCTMFSESFSQFAQVLICSLAARFSRKEDAGKRIAESFDEYRQAAVMLKKAPGLFIKMPLTSFLQLFLYHSIPFFCAKALGLSASWLPCVLTQSFLFVSVSSLPLPGASGVTEAGFAALFGAGFTGQDLASLLILSRTVSFIIPLIVTGILSLLARLPERG